jgi:hypothetical protein
MRPQYVSLGAVADSAPIPMDRRQAPFAVGLGLAFTGTATASVQHTFDDLSLGAPTTWFDHSVLVGKSVNSDSNYAFPVTAIRLRVTAWTSGSVTLSILQGERS